MQNSNKNLAMKVEESARLAAKSEAMREVLDLNETQWIGVFADLDEKKLDDLLMVLREEAEGYTDIEKKRQRRHTVNDTRRLQRLERLKIRMEEISKNASDR